MRDALALAESGFGRTDPNPRVGCVIGSTDGRVLGCGSTQQAGGAHAEVMALRDASAQGLDVRGATAWVTLEPCAHHGRTPPCCDALIAAGFARVVVAIGDPFPGVAGQGIARLRAAGIQVDLADAAFADAAHELNIGFFSRIQRGRPWVRMKIAASLDGRTALADGCSQWITGQAARRDGHAWRRRAGAVLTGIGTVLADDPRLDVRLVPTECQPLRVLIDSRLRLPADARVVPSPGQLLVFAAEDTAGRQMVLEAAGAQVLLRPGAAGRVDLHAVLADLSAREVNELHLEAGATLNGAWLGSGLVDELLLYQAPTLIGPGRPLAELVALDSMEDRTRWAFVDAKQLDADLRLRLRPVGSALPSVRFTSPDGIGRSIQTCH